MKLIIETQNRILISNKNSDYCSSSCQYFNDGCFECTCDLFGDIKLWRDRIEYKRCKYCLEAKVLEKAELHENEN